MSLARPRFAATPEAIPPELIVGAVRAGLHVVSHLPEPATEPEDAGAPAVTYVVRTRLWYLLDDYHVETGGHAIRIPRGFGFDLASVPRVLWWRIGPHELSIAAALVHDWLYAHQGNPPEGSVEPPRTYTREEADRMFRALMKREGVGYWRRTAAYLAVRVGGKRAWGD